MQEQRTAFGQVYYTRCVNAIEGAAEKLSGGYYRVRKTWEDAKSQIGAYRILANAKKQADANPGYSVFDPDGNSVYTPAAAQPETKVPFLVRVSIPDLNIRNGPGTDYARTGQFTGIGVFTIVEVSGNWGRLKSGAGWISLDFATRI